MSAECEKHGVDLHGNEWSEGGLVCPVCEREVELDRLRARLTEVEEAGEQVIDTTAKYLTAVLAGHMNASRLRGECHAALDNWRAIVEPKP